MTPAATTAALLARRRALVAASRKRHAPAQLPAAPPPSGIVASYTAELLKVARELNAETIAAVRDLDVPARLNVPRQDAQGDIPDPLPRAGIRDVHARLQALAERIVGRRSLVQSIGTIAEKTADYSRMRWQEQVKAAIGVDLTGDVDLTKRRQVFQRENLSLIKSLTSEHVARVKRVLTENAGARVETIAKAIEETTQATKSRAALIARDQVLKLNANTTRDRHEAAGITEFIWRTSRDERVRSEHRELEGRRFKYDDPPVVDKRTGERALPGTFYQCRCTAEPIIPGLDDDVQSSTAEERAKAFPDGTALAAAKARVRAKGGGAGGNGADLAAEWAKWKATPRERFAPPAVDPDAPPVVIPAGASGDRPLPRRA